MKPKDTEENYNMCICPSCAVYNECTQAKNEKFFCGRQKSGCTMDSSKMCICGSCPIYAANDLSQFYFCIKDLIK